MSNVTFWEIKKRMYDRIVTTLEVYGAKMTRKMLELKYSGYPRRKLCSVRQISGSEYRKRRKYSVRKLKKGETSRC